MVPSVPAPEGSGFELISVRSICKTIRGGWGGGWHETAICFKGNSVSQLLLGLSKAQYNTHKYSYNHDPFYFAVYNTRDPKESGKQQP